MSDLHEIRSLCPRESCPIERDARVLVRSVQSGEFSKACGTCGIKRHWYHSNGEIRLGTMDPKRNSEGAF